MATTSLRVTDALATRRYEVKYECLGADPGKVDAVLRVNYRPIRYGVKDESIVNSIYFDSATFPSLRENLAGVGNRIKIRFRWYDTPLPKQTGFLEVKRRHGLLVDKDRIRVESAALGTMSYSELIRFLKAAVPEPIRILFEQRSLPVVLVRYQRRHYQCRDQQLRITLDHNIEFVDQFGRTRPDARFTQPLPNRLVIECKSARPHSDSHLYPLRVRRSRFSKYVLSCTRTGLVSGTDEKWQ